MADEEVRTKRAMKYAKPVEEVMRKKAGDLVQEIDRKRAKKKHHAPNEALEELLSKRHPIDDRYQPSLDASYEDLVNEAVVDYVSLCIAAALALVPPEVRRALAMASVATTEERGNPFELADMKSSSPATEAKSSLRQEQSAPSMSATLMMLEMMYGEDYPAVIGRFLSSFSRGGKPMLLRVELTEALTEAQNNPCRDTWERLKKVLIETEP